MTEDFSSSSARRVTRRRSRNTPFTDLARVPFTLVLPENRPGVRISAASVERIPVSPEIARELGIVAARASGRVVAWSLALVGSGWFVSYVTALKYVNATEAAVIATGVAGGIFGLGVGSAKLWARRIRSASFVIRERGRFEAGGQFRAWFTEDRTRRSLKVSAGELMLDDDDNAGAIQTLWEHLDARGPGDDVLEIDYTPNRYLLSVRDGSGLLLFHRPGYVPPPSGIPASPLSRRSDVRVALSLVGVGFTLVLGSLALLAASVAGDGPQGFEILAISSLFTFVVALSLIVLGVFRLFVKAGDGLFGVWSGRMR